MRKANKKYTKIWLMALFLSANCIYAQQGIGTNKPNKAAVLDLTSASKGLLLPRIALKNTNTFLPVAGISFNESHTANSLIAYNTATDGNGENKVYPGFYYWEKATSSANGKWIRLSNQADLNNLLLSGDVVGGLSTTKVEKIQNVPVSNTAPNSGQVLQYNGTNWAPTNLTPAPVTSARNGLNLNNSVVELGGDLVKGTTINQKNNQLTLNTNGANLLVTGLNDNTVQNEKDYLIAINENNVIKSVKASLPKFFYMPSIMLPLTEDQIVPSMHTTYSNGTFTVDLYSIYSEQFGGTDRTSSASNPSKTTNLPVLPADELDYYITFYDNTVYTGVTVKDNGTLNYKISRTADPNDGSFMNIVFAVKP